MEVITDRLGQRVSADRIAKAHALVPHVAATNLPTVWDVASGFVTYRVTIDHGLTLCTCPARTSVCAHVLAVWLERYMAGAPVRVAAIDGPQLAAVPDDQPSDPFAGLGR